MLTPYTIPTSTAALFLSASLDTGNAKYPISGGLSIFATTFWLNSPLISIAASEFASALKPDVESQSIILLPQWALIISAVANTSSIPSTLKVPSPEFNWSRKPSISSCTTFDIITLNMCFRVQESLNVEAIGVTPDSSSFSHAASNSSLVFGTSSIPASLNICLL